MSDWLYNNELFSPDLIGKNIGFCYCITNTITGKRYIGKKLFTFAKTKQIKKKKKKIRVDSDWLTYYGSNDELNDDVKKLGAENFKREILHLCLTKGTANYMEAYEIMVNKAIISENFYNQWLSCKVSRNQIKL